MNEIIVPELNSETIESMIYEIRGVKVMLDFELAKIYGYETKSFNQQVKRNINRFPDRYRFQLTKKEIEHLVRSQIVTSRGWEGNNEGGRRYLPYAFTEQGIYMLMTVLKGELATKQSIILIDTFKQMKDYIVENNNLGSTNELLKLTNKVCEIDDKQTKTDKTIGRLSNDNKIIKKKLEIVMDNFIDPSMYKHFLILDGERIEADVAYQTIYKLAKKSIYIVDNYIDIKTLQLLKVCSLNIDIIIFSDNKAKNNLNSNFISDFKKDTGINIVFKTNNNEFHDRYIVIDHNTKKEMIYHCGASSKDGGNKVTTIDRLERIEEYKSLIDKMIENDNLIL